MSHSLDLLVWSCLFLAVESQQGSVLPPQNLSLLWVTGFQPQLSWAPPQHLGANCTYHVIWKTKSEDTRRVTKDVAVKTEFYIVMEGGFLNMTIQTVCKDKRSETAWLSVNHPELLRNLHCYIHSATQTHCSWQPASGARDLRFFYRLMDNDFSKSTYETFTLQECSVYHSSGGVRTGCDLEANIHQTIHMLLNGTVNNTLATNTFNRDTANDVRPPPLDWTVTKSNDTFLIKWTPPEIQGDWTYIINYTKSGVTQTPKEIVGETSMNLDRDPCCAYRIAIKAIWYGYSTREKKGETPYSHAKYFEADTDPNAWLYVAIIIPVMLAGLAALVLVCCRKNKEYIFPKVPEPRDLLSDISNNNNNNKDTDHSLYVPAEEDDNCEITLVVDPLINKLDL